MKKQATVDSFPPIPQGTSVYRTKKDAQYYNGHARIIVPPRDGATGWMNIAGNVVQCFGTKHGEWKRHHANGTTQTAAA